MFQSKTPSLWWCYLRTHWKMFTFGGLLKLAGDLAALVGPLSITLIVEYIEQSGGGQQQQQQQHSSQGTVAITTTDRPRYASSGSGVFPNGSINLNLQYPQSDAHLASNVSDGKWPKNASGPLYYPDWNDFIANGWIMGLLVLFASLAQGSLSQASTHVVNMVGIRLRTSLQSLVYRKTLLISSSCFFAGSAETASATERKAPSGNTSNGMSDACKGSSDGNDGQHQTQFIDAGTITNLMSEDALNVMSFLWIAHYVWAIPLKVCATYILAFFPFFRFSDYILWDTLVIYFYIEFHGDF